MTDMTDIEFSEAWLRSLQELNAVIAATGEPLAGNLFYDHLQASFSSSAPNTLLRSKRDRFRKAIDGTVRLLEVGVNGGHSAYLALTSNTALEFHGVDICEHAYVKPAVSWLQTQFPKRVFFYEGDCLDVLPQLRETGLAFDAFHIDGAKHTYYDDIRNCQRMVLGDRALVIVDDTQMEQVSSVWNRCLQQGRIQRLAAFPPMSPTTKYRNEIGQLRPESLGSRLLSHTSAPVHSALRHGRSLSLPVRLIYRRFVARILSHD